MDLEKTRYKQGGYNYNILDPIKHEALNQWWFNVGPASQTMVQH